MELLTFAAALALAGIHFLAPYVHIVEEGQAKRRFFSFAAGITVAYVFIQIIPQLSQNEQIVEVALRWVKFLNDHVYFIALLGLLTFYGLEKAARRSRNKNYRKKGKDKTRPSVFWVHVASFAPLNIIVGYLLVQPEGRDTPLRLLLFTIALGLHYFIVDYRLMGHHKEQYTRKGRWVLGSAILFGWTVGQFGHIPERFLALLFAFLAGTIILNTLEGEFFNEEKSSYKAFAIAVISYSVLLLIVDFV